MPEGQVLEFSGVTKRFGAISAVSDFTARVEPGRVTGFLGPNGAGKTTSLRILLGLVRASGGTATIGGVPYAKLAQPLQTVGAVLEASSFHPGRTAANHLRVYARAAKISDARVDEVLALVGLSDAAGRKVGGFSLGMRQRLGLAYALLGDPGVLVLDEPSNGLDPEGIRWMRGFLRQLAREGRTVLVSSHLLTEVQQTVDALLVISQGRLVFQGGLDELADPSEYATIVDAPDRSALVGALAAAEVPYEVLRSGVTVRSLAPAEIGGIAAGAGVALSSLQRKGPALEEVFLELVSGARVHTSATGEAPARVETAAPSVESAHDAATAEAETVTEVEDAEVEDAAVVDAPGDDQPAAEQPVPDAPVEDEEDRQWAAPAAGAAFTTSADGRTEATPVEGAGDAEADPAPMDLDAPHAFAVATTGVIDVVPPSAEWEPFAAHGDAEDAESRAEDGDPLPAEHDGTVQPEGLAADALVEEDADGPVDADIDVDALGEIDDELATPEDAEAATDRRPFDSYDRTESDVEADAFFSAFDEATREDAARDAAAGGDTESPPTASDERRDENEGGAQR